ncbi:RNA-directed DNA polymerase, eukaryota, reverse transcriptase zinc-binding domain protein, partial [Tanacetum coccineum]
LHFTFFWATNEIEREELRKKQENEGYEHVRYKKKGGKKENLKGEKKTDNEELKGKKVMYKPVEKVGNNEGETRGNDVVKEQLVDKGNPKTGWKVQNDIINSIRKSANKFAVLEEENENGGMPKRETEIEKEVIDVYDETSGSARKMAQKDIGSSYVEILNGTVLETRMKGDKIKEIGKRVFGRWNWYDNASECSRGCRVLIGWDDEKIQGGIVHASNQAVLCSFEAQSSKQRVLCTFIHAGISGKLRKKLWIDLCNYKSMINNNPCIMGDLNVILNPEDHSEGISYVTQDMEEFRDCINCIKMEDVCSSGLHYTWIKSLLNPNNRILNKIDRVMGNEEFFEKHIRAYVVFLPYGISDHSPAILTCPQTLKAKKKSFRFENYVADKVEFQGVVNDKWNIEVEGFAMFKLVKRLKAMKPIMNNLNWKNWNLFDKVKKLKSSLDEIQTRIEADPTNVTLREQGVSLSNRCRVEEISGEDNVRYSGDQVPIQFVKHFEKFLGMQNNMECLDLDGSMFPNKIETKWIHSQVFQKGLGHVGNDVCKAVKEFFSKGKLLGELNATLITLVPKVSTPHKWIMICVTTPSYSICLNGERHGFFKGGRGLRKGDPLSPYLFTLVMEVFNLIIQQEIKENRRFKYHHGCKELEITHLCFTDDLLVLCHGDVNSVNVIKKALDKFSSVSGLCHNLGKSTIFCGSMDRATIDDILHILPFKKGKIPVRYLGAPLVSKKIGVKDCKGLIDKVKSRVQDWKNNSLSYAGRTQLIASVLSSIQVYWASVFKLPKLVIDDIEKIFK